MEPTAVRTWNRPRTKATVTVTLPDGAVKVLGGKRAERAEAAIIMESLDYNGTPLRWKVYGLRADYDKAEVEAEKWRTDRPERYRSRLSGTYTTGHVIRGREAYAVEVEEG